MHAVVNVQNIYSIGSSLDNALEHFAHMGKGYCPHGYYRGWADDTDSAVVDAERCAKHCNEEPECLYFAVKPGNTCSRYNSEAGDCLAKVAHKDHELYKKIGMYTMHYPHFVY